MSEQENGDAKTQRPRIGEGLLYSWFSFCILNVCTYRYALLHVCTLYVFMYIIVYVCMYVSDLDSNSTRTRVQTLGFTIPHRPRAIV